jgi:hypothetical protein
MRATRVMQNRRREMALANELAKVPALNNGWKATLLSAGS